MKRQVIIVSCIVALLLSGASVAGAATIKVGSRVMPAATGVYVRAGGANTTAELFLQTAGVHGTVVDGPKTQTIGSTNLIWWKIDWDSAPPIYSGQLGWSTEWNGFVLLAPTAGDVKRPSFTIPAYTTANRYWVDGEAPASTGSPNCKLGDALGSGTWYAYGRMLQFGYSPAEMAQIAPAGSTAAGAWATNATGALILVDTTPTVGSIAQLNAGGSFAAGHVAVVESVNGDGTVTVTESYYVEDTGSAWNFLWRHRTVPATSFSNYIHVTRSAANGSPSITTDSMPAGTVGTAYSETLAATGGVLPLAWSISSGALPAGLDLDGATGEISGTPTDAGTSDFTAVATDLVGATDSAALSISVYPTAPSAELSWIDIAKFQVGLPAAASHDSFVLQGSFNMWPNGNVPETVTLHLGTWSVVMDAASWKKSGKTSVYTCKQDGVTAKVTYWVGGTSKCLFQFSGSKLTLASHLTALPNVAVRLVLGSDFDKTVTAAMTVKGTAAKLSSVGPLPLFCPEKVALTRNLKATGKDSLTFSAKVALATDFDPGVDAVTMHIGPYAISLPAATMPAAKNGLVTYKTATAHGKMTIKLSNKAHTLTVAATGIDLSAAKQSDEVKLKIANHADDWDYGLLMSKDKTGTHYKY